MGGAAAPAIDHAVAEVGPSSREDPSPPRPCTPPSREAANPSPSCGVWAVIEAGMVRIEVRDSGRWKARSIATLRGLGLTIARTMTEEVLVRTRPSGTTVSLTQPAG
jgi:hypothetical protein